MTNIQVEIYNNFRDKDFFELTAYYTRNENENIRVDIYPKIGDKIHTTYESFVIDEEANDIPTIISNDEWNEITIEVNRLLNIQI